MSAPLNVTGSAATLNIPLARKVLEHLIAHPDEHDQRTYGRQTACGTTHCIAGTALVIDGTTKIHWNRFGEMWDGQNPSSNEGLEVPARDLLGLSALDATELFFEFDGETALERLSMLITEAEQVQS